MAAPGPSSRFQEMTWKSCCARVQMVLLAGLATSRSGSLSPGVFAANAMRGREAARRFRNDRAVPRRLGEPETLCVMQITPCALVSAGGATNIPARPHRGREAPTCGGTRGSRALAGNGNGRRVGHPDRGRQPRRNPLLRGAPLLQLAQGSPAASVRRGLGALVEYRVGEAGRARREVAVAHRRDIGQALAEDPLFCDLLANLHLHLEHEVDAERVIEVRRISTAATLSLADSIGARCPNSGDRGRSTSCWPPTRWRPRCGRSPTRRSTSPTSTPRSPKWFRPSGIWTSHPP